jgi:hypothetical protein
MPFLIIDKKQVRVWCSMPTANGQLGGSASVLLGLAIGDDSVPGIGQQKLSSTPIRAHHSRRSFCRPLTRNLKGEEILWMDYKNAIAMHPVVTSNPKERRTEGLASSNIKDKRISYGCIHMPAGSTETSSVRRLAQRVALCTPYTSALLPNMRGS